MSEREREHAANKSDRGRGEWDQIDTTVFAVDRYLSFLAIGIRSLFGVLEIRRIRRGSLITRGRTRAVLFNQSFVTFPVCPKFSFVKDYKSFGRKDNICR